MNEKEKIILHTLTIEPGILERVAIDPGIFDGQGRAIYDEISRQFQICQCFDMADAAVNLGMKISDLSALFDGCYVMRIAEFERMVLDLGRQKKFKELLSFIKKEIEIEVRTDATDNDEAIKKIIALGESILSSDDRSILRPFDQIEDKEVSWLWPGRIPRGMITLIAGHPGIGKSFFATWLAAKLSRGERLPESDLELAPCETIIVSAEDDESLIKKRLRANGADLTRVFIFSDPVRFSLDDLRPLKKMLDERSDFCVIVLDPLNSFLGTADYFRDTDTRMKLLPLVRLARERDVTVLAIVHFNKKEDSELITRVGGSVAFAAVPRSILGISSDMREDSDPENRDRRLLMPLKMNLARRPDSLAFNIHEDLSLIFETAPVHADPSVMFSREQRERKQRWLFAESWIVEALAHGERTAAELEKEAEAEGLPRPTLFRARGRLESQGVIETRITGYAKNRKSTWKLKSQ
jgi:putative DNA primase/helicase